jgi:hypothetical protein
MIAAGLEIHQQGGLAMQQESAGGHEGGFDAMAAIGPERGCNRPAGVALRLEIDGHGSEKILDRLGRPEAAEQRQVFSAQAAGMGGLPVKVPGQSPPPSLWLME